MTTTVMSIDPRLRARRIAVRRAEGRRRLRTLVVGGALLAVALGSWGLTRSALLDLDHVRVDGLGPEAAALIQEMIPVERGNPLLDLDLASIEVEVTSLPWVESVDAKREWPGTLRLDVRERVEFAALPTVDGSFVIVDVDGVAMAAAEPQTLGALPVIQTVAEGELGTVQTDVLPALEVVSLLPDDLVPWIDAITVSPDRSDVELGLDLVGGARADLGDSGLLAHKLEAVRAILAGADLRCLAVIDVRVADVTTLTRDPVCDQQSSSGVESGIEGDEASE